MRDTIETARMIIDEAVRDAEIGNMADQAFWPESAVAVARAFLALSEEVRRLREELEYTVPLARLALEGHRIERVRAGHDDIVFTERDGVTWVGLWQDEYDKLMAAEDALAPPDSQTGDSQ